MWLWIERLGALILAILAGKELCDVFGKKNIRDDEVYTLQQAQGILKTNNEEAVVTLIESGLLKASKVGGEYRILGKCLKEFLEKN